MANCSTQLRQQLKQSELNAQQLEENVEDLTKSLAEARSQIRLLSARVAEDTVTGCDVKPKNGAARSRAGQAEATQIAQAKENLYCDLTGLIVRSVKRAAGEDVFDCIQTGRNGSMF